MKEKVKLFSVTFIIAAILGALCLIGDGNYRNDFYYMAYYTINSEQLN
jgi:hypothetical protein